MPLTIRGLLVESRFGGNIYDASAEVVQFAETNKHTMPVLVFNGILVDARTYDGTLKTANQIADEYMNRIQRG